MEHVFSETSGSWVWTVGVDVLNGAAEVEGKRSGATAVRLSIYPLVATHMNGFSTAWLQWLIRAVAGHTVAQHFQLALARAEAGK